MFAIYIILLLMCLYGTPVPTGCYIHCMQCAIYSITSLSGRMKENFSYHLSAFSHLLDSVSTIRSCLFFNCEFRIESSPTTMTLESRLFIVTRPPHVSLLFELILPHHPFRAAYFNLRLVPMLTVSVGCLM